MALLVPSVGYADAAQPEPPRLTGIIIAGTSRQAIFATPDGAGSIRAGEGDQIGPFIVHVIGGDKVELNGPRGRYVLSPTPDGAIRQAFFSPRPIMPLVDPYRRERETESDQ
jgi:hypothetical protein